MSDIAKENVVSLDDYGQMRRGIGNGPGTQALREVRDLAGHRLKQHVGRMMEKVDDALFARAEKAENNMAQTRYFDAMRELRIIRQDIEDDFLAGVNNRFNQGVPRHTRESTAFSLNFDDDSTLGLVGKDDMEEDLAITNMVTKTRGICTQTLYSLDKRIGFLIRDPDLEQWQNPLGPEAVCDAFREAAKRIETGLEIRLVIFKLFDQHVICHMNELYKEINQLLVKLGVLPEIRATVRRPRQPLPPHQMPGAPVSGFEPGSAPYASGEYSGGEPTYSGTAASGGMFPGGGYYPGGGASASLNALTFLQQGGVTSAADAGVGFGVDPAALASGSVNILHGIKTSPVIQDLGKAGDMTIDIVAMLFDYILDDPNIPDAMRALIGRLQIPVLKVALLEREFFTRKSHPARQLLNRLATTAVGWNQQQGSEDPLYRKVEATVQTIIDKFEDDIGLFKALLEDLDNFLRDEEKRAQQRAERSVKVMQGQERLEVAKTRAIEEVEPRARHAGSLAFVREFVTGHWKNLLFIICARQGKDSDEWKQAVATMDDLIWSVKVKTTLEDRKRLVAMQPVLLSSLRSGMERLSVPVTERDDFIARLVHAHGRTAVNADNAEADPQDNTPAAQPTDSLSQEVSEPDRIEPQEETADSPQPAAQSASVDDEFLARARSLGTGTWLEMAGADDKPMRAKLSWVSPITGTYLFTDRQGLKAGNYTIDELAVMLREGQARVINNTPLMDRAVGTVLKQYQQK